MDIPQELAAKLKDLIEVQGLQHHLAAEQLGLTRKQIYRRIKQLGLKTQRTGPRSGPGHPEWRGGRNLDADGYVLVYKPDHPHARWGKYVLEHRLVMEAHLGRYLKRHEVVHHKNNDNADNRLENLELFQSNADHLRHELAGKCPKWTEAGKERIRAGVRRAAATCRRLKEQRALAKQSESNHQKSDSDGYRQQVCETGDELPPQLIDYHSMPKHGNRR